MRVSVAFGDEQLEIEVPGDQLVAHWEGPATVQRHATENRIRAALEHPSEYPPLRQAIVPGDQVVVAFDHEVPDARGVLWEVTRIIEESGVDRGAITVLVPPEASEEFARSAPEGLDVVVHDPADRSNIAYLASTTHGRRVYLNRRLTDADFVLPVGRLAYNHVLGYEGPWGLLFPRLSDEETRRAFRARVTEKRPDRAHPTQALDESLEASWLLGCQLQLGILPGLDGIDGAFAGLTSAVLGQGSQALDEAWSFEAESRAEVVVAGVGQPGVPGRIEDLAEGLANAARLVQRGGKIVLLSRCKGEVGPALQRLIAASDPRNGAAALRGHEADPDFAAARQIARSVAWADVYLLSALRSDVVEDLSMIALDRPEEGRRLVAGASSCTVVSHADLTYARAAGD